MEGPFNIAIIFGVVVFFGRCLSSAANPFVTTKSSLTTAKVRNGNLIPKPTSYVGSMYVEPLDQSFNSSHELGVGSQRRAFKRPLQQVWEWDYWCQYQPKVGSCSGPKKPVRGKTSTRFYYKAQLDVCKPFVYSGCEGNENNFETMVQCERKCKGSFRMPIANVNSTRFCSLQPSAGMCLALVERFYYDIHEQQCKSFIYGGCAGNQNRFDHIERCEERCMNAESDD